MVLEVKRINIGQELKKKKKAENKKIKISLKTDEELLEEKKKKKKKITKKTHKKIAKVVKEYMNDPTITLKEIEERTGIPKSTAKRCLDKVKEIKDDRIEGICNKDLSILEMGLDIIHNRMKDSFEYNRMSTIEIAKVIECSQKRYSLFKGNTTDNEGGNISEIKILIDNGDEDE